MSPVLTWGLYFLATHQDIQDRVYEEVTSVLEGEAVTEQSAGHLVYVDLSSTGTVPAITQIAVCSL